MAGLVAVAFVVTLGYWVASARAAYVEARRHAERMRRRYEALRD